MPMIQLHDIPGFALGALAAGIKASGKTDLALILAEKAVAAAGVFTRNRITAAPVKLSRQRLGRSGRRARAVLVNSGNANACTGAEGMKNARATTGGLAEAVRAKAAEILVCSTGVIGVQLPVETMNAGIARLGAGEGRVDGAGFAAAIMTTDTVPKCAGLELDGLEGARLAGVCKGAGMIAPNMATMLAFLLTDADVAPKVLQTALQEAVRDTFNCVTVDGDTSTNDATLLLASGKTGPAIDTVGGAAYDRFLAGLNAVCLDLAEQLARDGEGATKLVRVRLAGARSRSDAEKAARTVAESPLVKTALFGGDPNWGRILMAVGRSGAQVREECLDVRLCGTPLFARGAPAIFDAGKLSAAMRAKEVNLDIDLGLGEARCAMLTCDYSYDYIRINAEYHT